MCCTLFLSAVYAWGAVKHKDFISFSTDTVSEQRVAGSSPASSWLLTHMTSLCLHTKGQFINRNSDSMWLIICLFLVKVILIILTVDMLLITLLIEYWSFWKISMNLKLKKRQRAACEIKQLIGRYYWQLNSVFSDWTIYLSESSESVVMIIIKLTESEHIESWPSHVGSAAVQVRLWEARLWCGALGQQTVLVTQRWDAELYKNTLKCFSDGWKRDFMFLPTCAACFHMTLWHMRSVGSVCKAEVHSVHVETGQNETWCVCWQSC